MTSDVMAGARAALAAAGQGKPLVGQPIAEIRAKAAGSGWVEDPPLTFTSVSRSWPLRLTVDATGAVTSAELVRQRGRLSAEAQAVVDAIRQGTFCQDCGAPNHLRHFDECPRHPENVKEARR